MDSCEHLVEFPHIVRLVGERNNRSQVHLYIGEGLMHMNDAIHPLNLKSTAHKDAKFRLILE